MKDERGIYYTPSLQDPETRMYVRDNNGAVEFRLWNPIHPETWEKHQWLPYEVIEMAAAKYRERGTDRNPLALYDLDIAKKLLSEG
ncbi:hypothetical protein [Pseudodesulfovibrio senegalensis]|jgi:hypothetical protein|uniref:Uncharacterized protein n=1 Tax=Pseudodesulfovibrio senegalensis TaxID=1721087 RepID=A0A6N6N1N0_9BACT|nr:hypothetical protein [Pseudodesulfovibrio senegalensis]KAB1441308.1 hypothetical protein F8A88_10150 [Pseudodesulfovibrio senegalensis]